MRPVSDICAAGGLHVGLPFAGDAIELVRHDPPFVVMALRHSLEPALRMPADWGRRSRHSTSWTVARISCSTDPSAPAIPISRSRWTSSRAIPVRFFHRNLVAHVVAPREAGGSTRHGVPADRRGEALGHRRVRLHVDRRGELQALVPSHI